MSVDTKQALRLVSCLANPSRLAAARWGAYKLRLLLKIIRNSNIGKAFGDISAYNPPQC